MDEQKDPIRVVLVGCGNWGSKLLLKMLDMSDIQVAGVIDPVEGRLAEVAKLVDSQRGKPKVRKITQYLDSIDALSLWDSVDALVIASPSENHLIWAEFGINEGKHVFVEKPITKSLAESIQLQKTQLRRVMAGKPDKVFMVGHVTHYDPGVAKFFEQIHSVVVPKGPVRITRSGRWMGDQQRFDFSKEGAESFSDIWWALAPHDVSSMLFHMGVPDKSGVLLYSDGRVQGTFKIGSRDVSLTVYRSDEERVRMYEVDTDKGPVVYDQLTGEFRGFQKGDLGEKVSFGQYDSLRLELREFVKCIRLGKQPETGLQQGLDTVRWLERVSDDISLALYGNGDHNSEDTLTEPVFVDGTKEADDNNV